MVEEATLAPQVHERVLPKLMSQPQAWSPVRLTLEEGPCTVEHVFVVGVEQAAGE